MIYTKSEVIVYMNSLVNKSTDHDGWFGAQCVDLIMHCMSKFCNFTPFGNAIDYMTNTLPPGAKRFRKGEVPIEPGDIPIWQFGPSDKYGHIGFCTAVSNNSTTCIEQNVDGGPIDRGGPARIRTRSFDHLVGFIRLPYKVDLVGDRKANIEHNYTLVPETGTFTVNVKDLRIRRGAPSTNAPIAKDANGNVLYYQPGDTINYDHYTINEGLVWIRYISRSGEASFVATGKWEGSRRKGPAWGTFK